MPTPKLYTLELTLNQINTIVSALRTDYKNAQELRALPIGDEIVKELEEVYGEIKGQVEAQS